MLINGFSKKDHPLLQLILECNRLHKRVWNSFVIYVLRSYNLSADCMAKFVHSVCFKLGTVLLDFLPPFVLEELRKDDVM